MNTLGIAPLERGKCQVCQEYTATNHYAFAAPRGFGSMFDGMTLELHCCDACNKKRFQKWFSEMPVQTEWGEDYTYEDELYSFLESLPVSSQEQIFNDSMDAQDWIDLHLGELSAAKKKQYGFDDEMFDLEYEI